MATAGSVRVVTLAGTDLTIPGVLAGEWVRLCVRKVFGTAGGTTATGVVVLF